jgi:hypothetical protein
VWLPVDGIRCLTPTCPQRWAPLELTMADVARLLDKIRKLNLADFEAAHGLLKKTSQDP